MIKIKCQYCGSRSFKVITRAIQQIEYNKDDEIINSDLIELDGIIEEEGFLCLNCNAQLTDLEVINEVR